MRAFFQFSIEFKRADLEENSFSSGEEKALLKRYICINKTHCKVGTIPDGWTDRSTSGSEGVVVVATGKLVVFALSAI